jgi:hypothetical protein
MNLSKNSSADEELKKMFDLEMELAKKAEEYNKRVPIPCPSIDRSALLFSFNMQIMQSKKVKNKSNNQFRKTWITG